MQAVDRITFILEYLAVHSDGATIREIAENCDLSQSVVHRFLSALKKHKYVYQDPQTKQYSLSIKLFSLGSSIIRNNDIRKVSRPYLERLRDSTRSFVFLCTHENDLVICIDTIQTDANISFFVKIGSIMPVNSSSAAQSIIAFQDARTIDRILHEDRPVQFTNRTLMNREQLEERFQIIRSHGYAICDEELDPGVVALSAPLKNYMNAVIGSITILKTKTPDAFSETLIGELKETARKISLDLGADEQSIQI